MYRIPFFLTILALSALLEGETMAQTPGGATAQTRFNKAFFDEVEPIKLVDPLAVTLGAIDKGEIGRAHV